MEHISSVLTPKILFSSFKLLLLSSLLLTSLPFLVISSSPPSELDILLKIKQQWNNQPPLHSWNSSTSPCHWPGINCTGGESVTGISLRSQNITGEIPPSICDLKNLTLLDLGNNGITGNFPTFLYNCTKLQSLTLFWNHFVGQLPNDINKLSPHLQYLYLNKNDFSGDIPTSLAQLKGLITLALSENLFNGTFPSELGNLENLEDLSLGDNPFAPMNLPKEFGMLKSLRNLWMTSCNLMGEIPNELANLTSLETLALWGNKLVGGIPSGLFLLKKLRFLDLSVNTLTGEIPTSMKTLNLEKIDLSLNNLTGRIPPSIALLPSLQWLRLSQNWLSGSLPQELGLHSDLEFLDVSSNQLSGVIPESLANCLNLEGLSIQQNNFSGKLPSLKSTKLTSFVISNNKFSGPIPNSIANWGKNLGEFRASNNMICGNIPVELTALSSLNILLLDGNQLSGILPSRIISWHLLGTLNLARNNFLGPIPAALGSLPNLDHLDLSNNKLSGHIPPELDKLIAGQKRITFNLSSNSLRGKIPHAFDNRDYNLSFLDNANLCSDNHISNLPRCFSFPQRYLVKIIVPGTIILLVFLYFTFFKMNMRRQEQHSDEQHTWELKPFHTVNFTEMDIVSGLTDINMIGSGGSGKVYMIIVKNSGDKVAVKRICNGRKQEDALEKQFLTEVDFLGTFRHANIVKLLCCVSSAKEKLLVYEYMENQSLDKWIHKKKRTNEPSSTNSEASSVTPNPNIILDWARRMQIAIGAARGLCYLHSDCSPPIIHRDVKSSNILLDSEFNAKIADFGLAKLTVKTGEPHTASAIAGSFGYIAPEYWRTKKLNEKIDVYSFGVVLLELTTGKHPCKGNDHLNLADWSWQHFCEEYPIVDALDKDIKEASFMEQMVNVFKLGLMCTSQMPGSRPNMKQVVELLVAWSHHKDHDQTQTVNEE